MSAGNNNPLLEGIIANARSEAEQILAKSVVEVAGLEKVYQQKAAEARKVEDRILEAQLDEISRKEESLLRNAQRKSSLLKGDRLRTRVMESVTHKMADLMGETGYGDILVGWIAEGAIGLDHDEAMVRCSFKEEITPLMLEKASQLVQSKTGRKIRLTFSDNPLSAQGVVVSSLDGKIAYNNQVATRITRYDRELKELMEGDTCKAE
ncbi:MAG: V-type ATP synthase subunit E family protein [Sphaerochaetaceae bacterium]